MESRLLRLAVLSGAALLFIFGGCKSSSSPAPTGTTNVHTQPGAINYTVLLGNDKIADKFGGILGLPTSFLFSRSGQKVKTVIGLLNHDDMEKAIEQQLAEANGSSGTPAPVTTTEIPGLDGGEHSVAQYKGKVVLVNFWATWCAPCRTEIPWLIEFQKKFGPQGLVILGVAMDDEGKKAVQPFVENQRFKVTTASLEKPATQQP